VGDTEPFAVDIVHIITVKLSVRGVGNRMNKNIDVVPIVIEPVEELIDLLITGDITGQNNFRARVSCELFNAALQFFIQIGKRQFGTFSPRCFSDAPRDRAIACQADNKGTLTLQETYGDLLLFSSPMADNAWVGP